MRKDMHALRQPQEAQASHVNVAVAGKLRILGLGSEIYCIQLNVFTCTCRQAEDADVVLALREGRSSECRVYELSKTP
jgi:hypothetical protein